MHKTLTPRFKFVYMALCLVGLSVAIMFTSWRTLLSLIGITVPIGVLAGMLQARAIDRRPADFLASRTAMDVRRALVASVPGTISIVLLRVTAIAVLIWTVRSHSQGRIAIWSAGLLSFLLARGLVALPAVLRLGRSQ